MLPVICGLDEVYGADGMAFGDNDKDDGGEKHAMNPYEMEEENKMQNPLEESFSKQFDPAELALQRDQMLEIES